MREKRLRALALVIGLCVILAVPVIASAEDSVFIVYPTGIDDTDNLQAAFDAAVAAGPGSTVQLVEGTYSISHTLFVANFDGCFRGAGKGETTIQTIDGFSAVINNVFMFYQDSECDATTIRVEDMSVNVVGKSEQEFPLWVFDIYGRMTGVPDFEQSYLSVFFEEVEIIGERGIYPGGPGLYDYDSNVAVGIWIGGEWIAPGNYAKPVVGTYSITECDFRSIWEGYECWSLTDSAVRVSQNLATDVFLGLGELIDPGNTIAVIERNYISSDGTGINNVHGWQSYFGDYPLPAPSSLKVSRNTIHLVDEEAWNGIWVVTHPSWSGESSELTVEISHNTIHAPGTADGIILSDRSNYHFGIKSMNAVVSSNTIVLENSVYGGIFCPDIEDAVISNNKISGIGDYGIITIFGEDLMLLGNNLQGFEGVPGAFGFGGPIVLYVSSYCTVVGGPSKTDVWDIWGDNNLLVGVNNMQGNPPGQDIADAMELKRGIVGPFRGH